MLSYLFLFLKLTFYLLNIYINVVILDHGIYKQLSEEFRKNYCHLWEALIRLDSQKIQQLGETFGVGKYARYFPVIFTGRTINRYSLWFPPVIFFSIICESSAFKLLATFLRFVFYGFCPYASSAKCIGFKFYDFQCYHYRCVLYVDVMLMTSK